MEQNFFESNANSESHGDFSPKQKRCSITAPRRDPEKDSSSFECNICLDSAQDPIVTVCGHLYCWPCIYKWLHVQSSSLSEDQQQQKCPVCKTDISPSLLVPLYGRGTSSEFESKKPHLGLHIPPRPQPSGLIASISHPSQQLHEDFYHSQSQSFLPQQYFPHTYGGYAAMASSNLSSSPMTNLLNPTIAMFGEMVYAGFFGSSETNLFAYPHQNSYPFLGNNNLRTRRHEMQLDKSLSRVSIFLFCCIVLCLLLF